MAAANPIPLHCHDLTNRRFGRLKVLRFAERKNKRTYWWCRCKCGTVKKLVRDTLTSGHTKSCGCLRRELTGAMARTHGLSHTPEYRAWQHMIGRCYYPADRFYAAYGGRGIGVCAGILDSFAHFFAVLGARPGSLHSIDRIDNDRGYDCGCCEDCKTRNAALNCRWATVIQQARNKRNNRKIAANGVTMTMTEWATKTGMPIQTICNRLRRGWSHADAICPGRR